jgi:hypothetical protein
VPSSGSFSTTECKKLKKYFSYILVGPKIFVVDKHPDNGTLVPKRVGVDTWQEMCFVVHFIIFQ